MLSAIVVAAGSSSRMGFDKLFARLDGQPVLWHSLAAFGSCAEVAEVVVVAREEHFAELGRMAAKTLGGKPFRCVRGGAERHLSVWEGLGALRSEEAAYVAIHDGARPLITPQAILGCLGIAQRVGASCCASRVPDTVKRAGADGVVFESVDRTGLWAMQTPQIFEKGLIRSAYEEVLRRGEVVTDEISAVQEMGVRAELFENPDWNFKITFPADLEKAAQVLRWRREDSGGEKHV
ncbi:MAG: 2-C-methyl-D-erythritol 4-phosphate cytidylyltransferase [Verrucomicrobiota bacterium]